LVVILNLLLAITTSSPAVVAQPSDATIGMKNFSFMPKTLTIAAGTTVVWTNTDEVFHTVTSDDKTTFDSGNMQPDAEFTSTFDTPGTYPYYCIPHGSAGGVGMAGTIIVTDASEE
jgi:plastocyanin